MKKIGLIADMEFTKHMQFRNYYYALLELYGDVRLVKNSTDLAGLEILFIGGAFHGPHMDVCLADGFIDECNKKEITVVLFSPEKILNSINVNPVTIYLDIAKSKKFIHYTYDIEDTKLLKTKLFRLAMSKHYKDYFNVNLSNKKDKIVFCGCNYRWRKPIIDYVRKRYTLDVLPLIPDWEEYMKTIAEYKYVLSPLGDANAIVTKYYEILLIHSIPIHQVNEGTLSYYNIEAGFKDCIYFKNKEEIPLRLKDFKPKYSQSEIWLEDVLEPLLKEDNLL